MRRSVIDHYYTSFLITYFYFLALYRQFNNAYVERVLCPTQKDHCWDTYPLTGKLKNHSAQNVRGIQETLNQEPFDDQGYL